MPKQQITLGEEIRYKRHSLGWSQTEFAARLNNYAAKFHAGFCKRHFIGRVPKTAFNKDTVSRWENDAHDPYVIHMGFCRVVLNRALKTNEWIKR